MILTVKVFLTINRLINR